MGCCSSIEASHQAVGKWRDQEIDEQFKKDRHKLSHQVKLLLLGAGESGKSTLVKQMRIIHEGGFPDEEKLSYRQTVFTNMIESITALTQAMTKLNIPIDDPENEDAFDFIHAQQCSHDLPEELCLAMRDLWQDEGVRACFQRRNEFQLYDTAAYYFDAMDRIFDPEYVPNDQDVLCTRLKTTSITETLFKVGDLTYCMVDVGGQRSERKKWMQCFEHVTAIIFMVAISEYDQVLFEDEHVNRMGESITLFQSICDMPCFKKTSTILLMNKTDIFKNKLKKSPLKDYFPDYQGGDDYDAGCRFLMEQFEQTTTKHADKKIYTHFTCATDTTQIRFVMSAVNDIILQSTLRHAGLV